jgi:hypothetical protein
MKSYLKRVTGRSVDSEDSSMRQDGTSTVQYLEISEEYRIQ